MDHPMLMDLHHPLSLQSTMQQQQVTPQQMQHMQQQQQMQMEMAHASMPMQMQMQMQMQPQMLYGPSPTGPFHPPPHPSHPHVLTTLSGPLPPPPVSSGKKRVPSGASGKPRSRTKKPRVDGGGPLGGGMDEGATPRPAVNRANSNRARADGGGGGGGGGASTFSRQNSLPNHHHPSGGYGFTPPELTPSTQYSSSHYYSAHPHPHPSHPPPPQQQQGRVRERVICLVPGSDTMKIGFADQARPFYVRQVVAYRVHPPPTTTTRNERGDDAEMKDDSASAAGEPSFLSHLAAVSDASESDLVESDEALLDRWRKKREADHAVVDQTLEALVAASTEKVKRRGQFQSTKADTAPRIVAAAGSIQDATNVIQITPLPTTTLATMTGGPAAASASVPPASPPRLLHGSDLTAPALPPAVPAHSYLPREPYSRGAFHLSAPGLLATPSARSLAVCMEWQEDILRHALATEMHLTTSTALAQHSVSLVVPDRWHSSELSAFLHLLLGRLGFASVFLLRECVAATFGAGLATACVVDLGATGTTVSCVEDGLLVAGSTRFLNYGGQDLDEVVKGCIQERSFWAASEAALANAATEQGAAGVAQENLVAWRQREQVRRWKEQYCYCLTSPALRGTGGYDDAGQAQTPPAVLAYSHTASKLPTAVPIELQFAAALAPLAYFYPALFYTALRTPEETRRQKLLDALKAREDPFAEMLPTSVVYPPSSVVASSPLAEHCSLFDPHQTSPSSSSSGADALASSCDLEVFPGHTNASVIGRSKKGAAGAGGGAKRDAGDSPVKGTSGSSDPPPPTAPPPPPFRLDRRRKDHQALLERYTEEQLMAGQHLKDQAQEEIDKKEREKKEQEELAAAAAAAASAGTPPSSLRSLTNGDATPPSSIVESFLAHREALHLAIAHSIQSATASQATGSVGGGGSLDQQQKLATVIVVTGGGSNLPRVARAMEERLVATLPYILPGVNTVACLVHPKGLDSHQLSWRGAAILARGETTRDMWMTADEWRRHGVRMLREKAPWSVV